MYYHNSDKSIIDCAIIKVDFVRKSRTYDQDGSAVSFSFSYAVRVENIEETMKYIKAVYDELNCPCSRIYLSGFACLTESYIWTKARITEHAINETKIINGLSHDSYKVFKK